MDAGIDKPYFCQRAKKSLFRIKSDLEIGIGSLAEFAENLAPESDENQLIRDTIIKSFTLFNIKAVKNAKNNPAQKVDCGPKYNLNNPPKNGPIEPINPVDVPIKPMINPLDSL